MPSLLSQTKMVKSWYKCFTVRRANTMLHPAKSKIATKQKSDLLYKAILKLETEEECYNFFQDLCTISEMRAMEQRFEVASLLNDGMIYNDILERTGASSATISRVNRSQIGRAHV